MKTLSTMLGALLFIAAGLAAITLKLSPNSWADLAFRYEARQDWILFMPWWQAAIASATGLACVIWGCSGNGSGLTTTTESTSHGSARTSTTKEICPTENSRRQGVVLAMEAEAEVETVETPDGSPLWLVTQPRPFVCALRQHVLVEGPTGYGKDVSIVIPTLLNDVVRSFVVLDPKGETYKATSGYRNRYQRVARFAPCDPDSIGCNPLLEVPLGTLREVTEAERISNVLVGSTAKEEMSSRIYLKSCETLLTAAILHLLHRGPRADRNLPGVLRTLTHPQRDEEDIADEICANPPKGTEMVMNSLKRLAQDQRMLKGAFTTALDVLNFCRMPTVAAAISRSDFRPMDLAFGKDPVTLYLEFPFRDADILRPLARLMLNVLLNSHRKERDRDTCYLLNELPSLGNITAISRGIGELREFGVQFAIFIQSFGQLESHYGREDARTLVDNCPVRATLGVAGQKAAEDVSARLGKATLVRPRHTQAVSRKSLLETTVTNTTGEGEQARELRTSDEVRAQESELVLVEFPSKRPYFGKRAVSYSDARLQPLTSIKPPVQQPLRAVQGGKRAG